jgi:O-antigen ligase
MYMTKCCLQHARGALMTTPDKVSIRAISQSAAFIIPLLLGFYWAPIGIAFEVKAMVLRCAMAGLVMLLFLLWFRRPLTRAETTFATLFSVLAVLLIVPCLTATDPARAFKGAMKLILLFAMGLAMARALRHGRTARAFGYAMLLGSAVTALLILGVYVQHMGLTLPGYEAVRKLKGLAMKEGIALNPMGFTAFFMYIVGLCIVSPRALIWCFGIAVFAVSSCLTGSRAPVAIMLLSGLLAAILHLLRSRSLALHASGWAAVLLLSAALVGSLVWLDAKKMSAITEGRSDLWPVAWSKFVERPFSGYGYESWRDDLLSRFSGGRMLTLAMKKNPEGGYHNQYITLLAEQGLIVFVPVMAILWTLLKCCTWLASRTWISAINRHMIMLGCLFMLLRAGVEVPGLFGYANDPADYLAYCFLAVVVSRLSQHEDRHHSLTLINSNCPEAFAAPSAASLQTMAT